MRCKWKQIKVGDLGTIVTGKTPPTKKAEYWGGSIPFITPKDLQRTKHVFDTERFITDMGLESVRGCKLPSGAVCVSCIGNIGYVAMTNQNCISNQQINSIIVSENYDPNFVYYLMKSLWPFFKNYEGQSTTLSILNKTQFSKIEIAAPDLSVQKRIASILSSLDDKIELNNKINENLEQQLRTIFKSRFTDNPTLESMMQIPLSELCRVITKGTTPTTLGKPFVKSGINFIKAESILDNHSIDKSKFAFIDHDTNTLLKRSAIQAGDIVFTIAGTLGRFALIDENVLPANTNQAVAIIRVDVEKVLPEYIYTCLLGEWHTDYYSKRVQQAVQANLSLTTIKSLPVPVLNREEMNKYMRLILPLIRAIKENEVQNEKLSVLRDTLLPKLMSGEIDVGDVNA